ncbi:kinetochore-associated Ndc80 complex subunit ndc80, partial [Ascosphaera pollenicola]
MAHDQGMFSARRPRETLANVQNLTGIPQPASAIKRTSSVAQFQNPSFSSQNARASIRQSMSRPPQPSFGRMSISANANNLGVGAGVDGGLSSVRRSVAGNMLHGGAGHAAAPRHSMAPPPVPPNKEALQRRSSVLSRPSIALAPMGNQSFFTQTPMAPGVPRDPRPLRDRSFQARISQELLEYLAHNNFELEMKHSLTQNTLKSPTQKDFTYIFQWLYHRIDPSYKFIKSMDAEVPPILKQLRYPYAGHITKSQITAVGGQNWSTFLGMLHWMMQLAQMLDKYSVGTYDDACAEAGVDITGDRIIFNFLTGAYRDWLQAGEDEDDESAQQRLVPHIEAMAAEFEKVNEKYVHEAQALEGENRNLRNQLEELEKNAPDMNKLERHFKILEEDKKKFEEYNENVQSKIHKYEHRVKFFDDEIAKTEAELQAAEEEQSGLQESVDRQGITIQDIDRMNTEQERLQKSLDDMLTKLQALIFNLPATVEMTTPNVYADQI